MAPDLLYLRRCLDGHQLKVILIPSLRRYGRDFWNRLIGLERTMPCPGSTESRALREERKPANTSSGSRGGKRKAETQLPPRARHRRHSPTGLKDAEYIRDHFEVPTAEDYPDAPPALFSNFPKGHFHNLTQGLAQVHSDFSSLGVIGAECTLTCVVVENSFVVKAEGTNKVGDLCSSKPVRLTICRNLLKTRRIYSWWWSCTEMAF